MKKMVVGILPKANLYLTDDPYDDYYKFVHNYGKKIIASGGIPIGILMDNNKLNYDALELCDAFLIPGGKKIDSYITEVIYYCIKSNKPLLGICLGSQAIAIFSAIWERIIPANEYTIAELIDIYNKLKKEFNGSLLQSLNKPNIHEKVTVNRTNQDEARHDITIDKNSLLYSIYNTEKLNVISIHNFDYKYIGKNFKVSAKAEDGVNEAIEYNDPNYFILGIHFHPELEENNLIFERLIKEAEKRS